MGEKEYVLLGYLAAYALAHEYNDEVTDEEAELIAGGMISVYGPDEQMSAPQVISDLKVIIRDVVKHLKGENNAEGQTEEA
jgi:hypothetical protein